ncbi:glycosyltransferase [uncultured Fibrella sp.]|uniref:glycosyltransferase n=1 Tax=uncultured Fibrella sp. TaxID=1284596 RepID=UPI0035CC28BA
MNEPTSKKKTLLIFVEYFLPGYKSGGPVHSISNLLSLLKNQYTIYLVSRDRDYKDDNPYAGIVTNQWLDRTFYSILYASPRTINSYYFKKLITQTNPDHIYLNSLFGSMSRILLLISFAHKRKIIIAPRGELQASALSIKYQKKRLFLALLKRIFNSNLITWHATSKAETEAIKHVFTRPSIKFIPIILAPDTPALLPHREEYVKEKGVLRMVFISRIAPVKNLHFLLDLFPKLSVGKIHLSIYGHINDDRYWKKCNQLITAYSGPHEIKYQNYLPNGQVPQTLAQNDFFVLPTLGESFGHAIFESLSIGVPVLISDQTPWRNLSEQLAGSDLPLEGSSWIDAINHYVSMENDTYQQYVAGALRVSRAYIDEQQFHESYSHLFS